ncbi:cellulase family glycosylhydrolase [Alkalihalobacillus sp. 1P02AB]|uniref:cellulase family glycosylhydrolase n=1 Tax=Alkalihalobacillus sp. 1P02AB TaxID=3132260 RepID=UPI0039A5E7D5
MNVMGNIGRGRLLWKTSMSILAAVLVISMFLVETSFAFNEDKQEVDIQQYVEEMQPGWNLGNTFDAVGEDETAWGNPFVSKELIKEITAQGFKSIRIPLTFDQRMAEGPDYTIKEDFLNRITQAVDWSLEEGLYVMINVHHDSWIWLESGMYEEYDESFTRFQEIWQQLSAHFKDYPLELMFESINEPRFWGTEEEKRGFLYDLNTSFYDIVRESGGHNDRRPLVLPTLDSSPDHIEELEHLYETIIELDDPYLISTVHFYGFWPFSVNVAGYTHFDNEVKNHIMETFDRVADKFTANGIPVVLGEYGLLGFDTHTGVVQQGEKLKFFEFMIHYAQEKEIIHMLWDNGQHFGRTTFEWADQELYDMMRASWESRSATAEANFLYLHSGEDIEDRSLELNLNGNEFVSLLLEGQPLIEGEDYVLDGQQLIVKANLLEELTSADSLGENALLTATFNQGADWYIKVIVYDTPVLENSEGNTSDYVIPTQFNGDALQTMEAIYPDGSAAGPHDWTTFKEFGYAFSPDYEKNEISFPYGRFFDELNDGDVNLTFYFWSGETLSYQLTKNGDEIVGIFVSEDEKTPPETEEENPVPDLEEENDSVEEDQKEEQIKELQQKVKELQEQISSLLSQIESLDETAEISEIKRKLEEFQRFLEEELNSLEFAQALNQIQEMESELNRLKTIIEEWQKEKEKEEEISSTNNNEEEGSSGGGAVDKKGGDILPNTATNVFNYLLLGGLLFILGAALTVYLKRRQSFEM